MRIIILLLAILFILPSTAQAKCYSPAQAQAEQAIKIHSELMVIGLNCQHMTPAGWQNFYTQYRSFSQKNSALFSGYDQTMKSYFGANADKKLHAMRTQFANKISSDIARMRPDVFCSTYAPRIPQVANMSRGELVQWITSSAQSQALSRPLCN